MYTKYKYCLFKTSDRDISIYQGFFIRFKSLYFPYFHFIIFKKYDTKIFVHTFFNVHLETHIVIYHQEHYVILFLHIILTLTYPIYKNKNYLQFLPFAKYINNWDRMFLFLIQTYLHVLYFFSKLYY